MSTQKHSTSKQNTGVNLLKNLSDADKGNINKYLILAKRRHVFNSANQTIKTREQQGQYFFLDRIINIFIKLQIDTNVNNINKEMAEYYKKIKTSLYGDNILQEIELNNIKSNKDINSADTIVGVMLFEKIRASTKIYMILLAALLIYPAISSTVSIRMNSSVLLFLCAMLLLAYLNQWIMCYRIKKGYYGNNSYEIKEIIEFVTRHTNKDDFTRGGKVKDIFPAKEIERSLEEESNFQEAII